MSTSIMATICAERLTKILVRYSRAPQPTLVRNDSLSQSHVQCPLRSVNPLPRSEATVAYLKPLASGGQAPSLGNPPAKWQPLASFSKMGQRLPQANRTEQPMVSMGQNFQQANRTEQPLSSFSNMGQKLQQANRTEQPLISMSQKFQQAKKTEQPLLRPKTEAPQLNLTKHTQGVAGKSRGSQDWKHLGSSRYSAPFASIFQGQKQVPLKNYGQDSIAFHALRSRFPCLPCQ